MRLVEIHGQIWELTILQNDRYAGCTKEETLKQKNYRAIQGLGWKRGIVRVLSKNGVKSKAYAVIETVVNGLPNQMSYDIYHNSKGFFCKVQGERIFLVDLLEDAA